MFLLLAVTTVSVSAVEPAVQLQYETSPVPIDTPAKEAFWQRFTVEFTDTADELFARRLHPFKVMKWNTDVADQGFGRFGEWSTKTARKSFTESMTYGIREAAVDLPIMYWLEDRQGLLADFLRNSVANVEEEELDPLNLSSAPVKGSLWSRSKGNDIYCGVRPFRTDPYAFISMRLKERETILLTNLRYHLKNFSEHRFELALQLPLAYRFSIEVGASYSLGRHDNETRFAIKAFKEFRKGRSLLVGFDMGHTPEAFAGLTIPL